MMRLDELNRWLGVKTPAELLKACPKCRSDDLFRFEGEVFCNACSWDSVIIHAEILGQALLRKQQKKAGDSESCNQPKIRPAIRESVPMGRETGFCTEVA